MRPQDKSYCCTADDKTLSAAHGTKATEGNPHRPTASCSPGRRSFPPLLLLHDSVQTACTCANTIVIFRRICSCVLCLGHLKNPGPQPSALDVHQLIRRLFSLSIPRGQTCQCERAASQPKVGMFNLERIALPKNGRLAFVESKERTHSNRKAFVDPATDRIAGATKDNHRVCKVVGRASVVTADSIKTLAVRCFPRSVQTNLQCKKLEENPFT